MVKDKLEPLLNYLFFSYIAFHRSGRLQYRSISGSF